VNSSATLRTLVLSVPVLVSMCKPQQVRRAVEPTVSVYARGEFGQSDMRVRLELVARCARTVSWRHWF
jgi:hypothetical protein